MLSCFGSIMCTQESPPLSLTYVGPLGLVGFCGIEIKAIRSSPKRGGDVGGLSSDGSSYKKENKCTKALYGALTHWL